MKLACEIPVSSLSTINPRTDFDFIIASHCVNNALYKEFFVKSRKDDPQRYSILDNGAFEEGKAIDSGIYKELVELLQPNMLVLPDVVNDMMGTINASEKFIKDYDDLSLGGLYATMGVLQGNSVPEYMKCLEEYGQYEIVDTIGIPYHLFYRPLFIEKNNIIELCEKKGFEIHILGLPNPFEVVELAKYPTVIKSIDTSLPIVSAKNFKSFTLHQWKRERLNIEDVYNEEQEITAISNIEYLQRLIKLNYKE